MIRHQAEDRQEGNEKIKERREREREREKER